MDMECTVTREWRQRSQEEEKLSLVYDGYWCKLTTISWMPCEISKYTRRNLPIERGIVSII